MTVDRQPLLAALRDEQPSVGESTGVSVPGLVREWLDRAAGNGEPPPRAELDELCRQIDVRKRLSIAYGDGWATATPEEPASPIVVVGVAAVLLATAQAAGADGDGWDLKLVNTALKALDLVAAGPHVPATRAWAVELLDRATGSDAS